jgi:hypothetical protein
VSARTYLIFGDIEEAATSTIPVVFAINIDPVASGLVLRVGDQ